MCVGFAFKGDVDIGLRLVAGLHQTEKPFQNVEYVEGYVEQFALLGIVDSLVVDDVFVDPAFVACEVDAEEV